MFVGTLKRSMQNQDAATAWAVEALEAVKTARAKAVSDGLDPAEEAALAREATARFAVRTAEDWSHRQAAHFFTAPRGVRA